MTEDEARTLFLDHCQPGDRGALERYGAKAAVAAIMSQDNEIGRLRELLAAAYVAASGSKVHSSDCATSCAPAEEPRACDCGAAIDWRSIAEDAIECVADAERDTSWGQPTFGPSCSEGLRSRIPQCAP